MSAVILAELDPHKARHVSGFWKYCGVDVAADGRGRSRRAEHLVERPYVDKDGQEAVKRSVTFNPFVKTKLVGVLGSSFLKQPAAECTYRQVYDDYKHRLETHPVYGSAHDEKRKAEFQARGQKYAPKGHRHNMAVRYCIKMFLADLWLAWRRLEGLPVTAPYHEAVLGHAHDAA